MSDFSWGDRIRVTVFGQSHAPAVGCVIEGFPAGFPIDWDRVNRFLARRAPGQGPWSTPRKEADRPEILSGLDAGGLPCGAPITAVIRNENVRSGDYAALENTPRPGHADFSARLKYGGHADLRGGGPFSARLTAPLCLAGALALQYLESKGVRVAAHIASVGGVEDAQPDPVQPRLPLYAPGAFPVIDPEKGEAMKALIEEARRAGDSVGGVVRCVAAGLPGGLGGPLFGGLEGKLSQALFAIPAVRGVAFGAGFDAARMRGSAHNDAFQTENGKVVTATNRHGGILGGISTGMPLLFTAAFKPTPSIALPQQSVDLSKMQPCEITVQGRHDPCVVPRAVPVVEAVAALVLMNEMMQGA